jgi:hypothetical protein
MSDNPPLKLVPSLIFLVFVVIVGIGALLAGAPKTPQMPGVRLPTPPRIEGHRSEVEPLKDPSSETETTAAVADPTLTDAQKKAEETAVAAPTADSAATAVSPPNSPATTPAPAAGGAESFR